MKKILFCCLAAALFLGLTPPADAQFHGGHYGNFHGRTANVFGGAYNYGLYPSVVVLPQTYYVQPSIASYAPPALAVQQTTTTTTYSAVPAASSGVITSDPGVPTLSAGTVSYVFSLTPTAAYSYLNANYGRFANSLFTRHFGTFTNGVPVFNAGFQARAQTRAFNAGVVAGARATGGVVVNNPVRTAGPTLAGRVVERAVDRARFDLRREAFRAGQRAGFRAGRR